MVMEYRKKDGYLPIRILQYRADKQDGHYLDDAISWWTKPYNKGTPDHSHTEKLYPDGKCFSSTTRGGAKGTRFEDFEVVTKHKNRWDIYVKWFPAYRVAEMRARAESIVGMRYYFAGIFLDFFMPLGWLSQGVGRVLNQWYCSQAVYYALYGKRVRVSPRRLTTWICEDGFELEVAAGVPVSREGSVMNHPQGWVPISDEDNEWMNAPLGKYEKGGKE